MYYITTVNYKNFIISFIINERGLLYCLVICLKLKAKMLSSSENINEREKTLDSLWSSDFY